MAKAKVESEKKSRPSKQEQPEVKVFGEVVSSPDKSYSDAGSGVWGVFLIFVGLIILANVLGLLTWGFWENIWQFWPVLLVLLGIHILLGNNFFSRIVLTLAAIAIFGLITIWGLKQVNSDLLRYIPQDLQNLTSPLEDLDR